MHSVRSTRIRRAVAAIAVVVAASTGVAASCEWPSRTRYVKPVFNEVTITRGIAYRTTTDYQGNAITLRLDVYEPTGDTAAKRPVVMWQFGGGWRSGDRNQLASYAQDAAQRGYVGVTIDYRTRPVLSGTGDLLAAANDAYQDSQAAIQWLIANAASYRIDPKAVITAGYSAGAINAMGNIFSPEGPSPAAGGVAIAGFSFAAPSAGDRPILMFQGTADTIVSPTSSANTCNATKAKGNVCDYVTYQGGDHFITFTQATDIRTRTARWIFEKVLIPLGYPAEQVP